MRKRFSPNFLHYFFAIVWIANGFFCKVLNLIPRHQKIVSKILGSEHAELYTFLIGLAEIGMAVWILSGFLKRINAITQIFAIALMNVLEFFLVPDLLLWGRANIIFASLFIVLIYINEFRFSKKITQQAVWSRF